MTDPLRRDPREFQRVLKMMAQRTSWQKTLLFASRGRAVGFSLGVEHYNQILFSQSLWGRALEIIRVLRAMQEDGVRPNGISYYYVCHGMANADHGSDITGFEVNKKLRGLQHWRVALNALEASEANGYDPSETMYNSALVSCVIPGIGQWERALGVVRKMQEMEFKLHPEAARHLERTLIAARRPAEATALHNLAADMGVGRYRRFDEIDVFNTGGGGNGALDHDDDADADEHTPSSAAAAAPKDDASALPWDPEADENIRREESLLAMRNRRPRSEAVFRPRVYRQLWWKWHAVANKYRPTGLLTKRQLGPKDSPTGIPGFNRL